MAMALDREVDAVIARLTGDEGPFALAHVVQNGVTLPVFRHAPPTIPDLFRHYCAQFAERTFLVDGPERLSFVEVHALARGAAGGLVAGHGVKPGDRVGIAACNGNGWIIAYMAIIMAGGVATLLNGFWTGDELVEAIEDVGCTLVLADGPRMARIESASRRPAATLLPFRQAVPVAEGLAGLNARGGDENTPLPQLATLDDATILFTSGSTGRSKGAYSDHLSVIHGTLSYACMTMTMLEVNTARGQGPTHLPATLLNVPLFHVTAEITVLLQSFVLGRKLVLMAKWDAEEAMRLIEAEEITYFTGVPLMSNEIATHPRRGDYDLSTLKDIAAGGAPRPPEQVGRIKANLPWAHPVLGYGLTETNAVGCANVREAYLAKPSSTGRAHRPLVELAILDDAGNRLPEGTAGEICFRTIANIKGYWNRPEETAALFTPDRFLRTGDLGYLDEDGYLFIVDRKKDIIIRGGENISGAEVEAAIYSHPAVAECTVFGVAHDRYGEVPAAVVHLRAGMTLDAETLCESLKAKLSPFKLPAFIWFSETSLPRLGTEKIDRRAVREAYRSRL